ncbi:MAG: trypsin-like serine peptidase, partial [Acidimicrobiales bacterium]
VVGRPVYVIGYPAWDGRRNEPEPMRRIFMDVYNVKRLQPGVTVESQTPQTVLRHDCSTLGGNSGSPVFDLASHTVVGLHFGGRYGVGNYAVPLWRMVDDPLVASAGLNFADPAWSD